MSESPHETRFSEPGSLREPGPLGRALRLLLGAWLLYTVWSYWTQPEGLVRATPPYWTNAIGIALALWLIPPVVNIGLGRNWKAWPRHLTLAVMVLWAGANALLGGDWWSPGLGRYLWLLCLYTFGHLGLSFLLAAVISTPGCEMRAIPHLWTLLTGRATREHFCPGFLTGFDAWEAARSRTGA